MVRVGIIGFGTIGRGVAKLIWDGLAGDTCLTAVLVREAGRIDAALSRERGFEVHTELAGFRTCDADWIVETAGHDALRQYAVPILEAGKNLMAISAGAFADAPFLERVAETAARHGRQVRIPSGAVSGLDGISAAALAEIDEIRHTTRKPIRAFTSAQLGGTVPGEARVLFDGVAADGVRLFPENVNVAAAVALAGIGFAKTRLRVIADPDVDRNVQEVELRGWCGELLIRQQNRPTDNPRTGRIVALSIARALRNLSAPIVFGV